MTKIDHKTIKDTTLKFLYDIQENNIFYLENFYFLYIQKIVIGGRGHF